MSMVAKGEGNKSPSSPTPTPSYLHRPSPVVLYAYAFATYVSIIFTQSICSFTIFFLHFWLKRCDCYFLTSLFIYTSTLFLWLRLWLHLNSSNVNLFCKWTLYSSGKQRNIWLVMERDIWWANDLMATGKLMHTPYTRHKSLLFFQALTLGN